MGSELLLAMLLKLFIKATRLLQQRELSRYYLLRGTYEYRGLGKDGEDEKEQEKQNRVDCNVINRLFRGWRRG